MAQQQTQQTAALALAPRASVSLALGPQTLEQAMTLAGQLAQSDLVPDSYRGKPANVIAAVFMANDLGINVMQAMREIHVIKGKPSLSASMKVALVRQSGLCEKWEVVTSTAEKCTIRTKRKGEAPAEISLTIAEARAAGLTSETWQKFPARMLLHRVESWLADQEYQDVTKGLKTPDEVEHSEPAWIGAGATAAIPVGEPPKARAVKVEVTTIPTPGASTLTVGPAPGAADVVDAAAKPADPLPEAPKADEAPPHDATTGEVYEPATLAAALAKATNNDEITHLRSFVDKIAPKGHADRPMLGAAVNEARARVQGAGK